MNFLPASLVGGPADQILGIRPEQISIDAAGPLNGTVVHVEKLGGDTNVLVDINAENNITVRVFGQYDIGHDAPVTLGFKDADAFHFDQAGRRVA